MRVANKTSAPAYYGTESITTVNSFKVHDNEADVKKIYIRILLAWRWFTMANTLAMLWNYLHP